MERKIQRVIEICENNYGKPKPFRLSNSLDLLVETILSQNTNDKNTFKAFSALKKYYVNYEEVLAANETKLAKIIYSSGFYNLKAKRIQEALRAIKEDRGSLNLDFLKNKSKSVAFNYLIKLPGIGPKTAAIVLTFGLNHESIPVDTHVYRVSQRLGLVPKTFDRTKTQEFLENNTKRGLKNALHYYLIKHGREVCRARKPSCSECFLKKECKHFKNK